MIDEMGLNESLNGWNILNNNKNNFKVYRKADYEEEDDYVYEAIIVEKMGDKYQMIIYDKINEEPPVNYTKYDVVMDKIGLNREEVIEEAESYIRDHRGV